MLVSALTLENLRVRYDDFVAVDGVSLRVDAGEVHALLGASGAGKTSILRAVAGFERIESGTIDIAGARVDDGERWTPPEDRNVGVVFQDYALFPHLSVGRNIAFGMRHHTRAAVAELLERVGLPDARDKRPSMLSGGEQQRVALARALGQEPGLLLLDEPFAHLDPWRRESLRDETLRVVRRAGVATLLVTHDAADALSCADIVHVVDGGRVRQSGPPRDLYIEPVDVVVARAVGPVQLLPCVVDDKGLAQTLLGPVALRSPAKPGARGDVLVRPESLRVLPSAARDGRRARVTRRAFRGADIELHVRVEGDVPLRVLLRAWDAPDDDNVRVEVAQPCVLLEAESHPA